METSLISLLVYYGLLMKRNGHSLQIKLKPMTYLTRFSVPRASVSRTYSTKQGSFLDKYSCTYNREPEIKEIKRLKEVEYRARLLDPGREERDRKLIGYAVVIFILLIPIMGPG